MTANVIETIGSLTELKAYACPRVVHNKEWYLKCVDCKGQKDCTAGKRAVELLNRQTKPNKRNYNTKGLDEQREFARQNARDEFRKVLQHDDPVKYYSETHHVPIKNARVAISHWKRMYPDIYKEKYGENVPIDGTLKKVYDKARIVFAKDDPYEYLTKEEGRDHKGALRVLRRWVGLFPDLDKEFHISERYDSYKHPYGRPKKEEKGEETMPSFNCAASKTDTDEMSVSDFLAEQAPVTINAVEKPTAATYKAEKIPPTHTVSYERLTKEDVLYETVKAKQAEIRKGIAAMEIEIAKKKEQLETLTKTLLILTEHVAVGDI